MPSAMWLALHHHDRRVPADVGADPPLGLLVAGEPGLLAGRDGVDVGGRNSGREPDLGLLRPLQELHQQEAGPALAVHFEDVRRRNRPTPRSRWGRCRAAGGRYRRRSRLPSSRLTLGLSGSRTHEATCDLCLSWLLDAPCFGRLRPEPEASPTAPGHAGRVDERTSPASWRDGPPASRRPVRRVVYTDGACLGNPGPGGWAWAVPDGRWRSGADAQTTNQRMELTAALDAVRSIEGPLVGRERQHLRRQLLPRRVVGGVVGAGLGRQEPPAGCQPGPLGSPWSSSTERPRPLAVLLGEGPRQRPFQRPCRPARRGRRRVAAWRRGVRAARARVARAARHPHRPSHQRRRASGCPAGKGWPAGGGSSPGRPGPSRTGAGERGALRPCRRAGHVALRQAGRRRSCAELVARRRLSARPH